MSLRHRYDTKSTDLAKCMVPGAVRLPDAASAQVQHPGCSDPPSPRPGPAYAICLCPRYAAYTTSL
eukprot:1618868-Rhodomonas_salina.2